MAGPKTIREHITPRIGQSAEASGRDAPRVCVGLPTTVCDDEAAGRRQAAEAYERYGQLVNYRRVLDIEGVEGPSEVCVVGKEDALRRQLEEFRRRGRNRLHGQHLRRRGRQRDRAAHLRGAEGAGRTGVRDSMITQSDWDATSCMGDDDMGFYDAEIMIRNVNTTNAKFFEEGWMYVTAPVKSMQAPLYFAPYFTGQGSDSGISMIAGVAGVKTV